jgi:hypothetical protein
MGNDDCAILRLRGKNIRIEGDWAWVKVRVETKLPDNLQRECGIVQNPHVLIGARARGTGVVGGWI